MYGESKLGGDEIVEYAKVSILAGRTVCSESHANGSIFRAF